MLSIQEMVDKTREQRKQVERSMDSTGGFHPEDASILNTVKPADYYKIKESLKHVPLREFLAKSGTTGIMGAAYLVPDKIHSDFIEATRFVDLAPAIGFMVNGWEGGDLKVNIPDTKNYKPSSFSSGGGLAKGGVATVQATLHPQSFQLTPEITEDLMEEAAYDVIDAHLRFAAQAMASESNNRVLTVLKAPPDGWGTLNTAATGDADSTKYTGGTAMDVVRAALAVGRDRFHPNTMVVTEEAWYDAIIISGAAAVLPINVGNPAPPPFKVKVGKLDVAMCNEPTLHLATDAEGTFTDCVTLIFDRNNAILTGRKRWLEVQNYVDPVRDLRGMVISSRQDSVTLNKDAVYNLYES